MKFALHKLNSLIHFIGFISFTQIVVINVIILLLLLLLVVVVVVLVVVAFLLLNGEKRCKRLNNLFICLYYQFVIACLSTNILFSYVKDEKIVYQLPSRTGVMVMLAFV